MLRPLIFLGKAYCHSQVLPLKIAGLIIIFNGKAYRYRDRTFLIERYGLLCQQNFLEGKAFVSNMLLLF